MNNIERFENASQFLACYFHLDWKDQFEEPEDAVAQFIKDADRETRAAALFDLKQIVKEFQGPDLNKVLLQIACFYSPERYRGISMGEWLEQVIAEIEGSLNR